MWELHILWTKIRAIYRKTFIFLIWSFFKWFRVRACLKLCLSSLKVHLTLKKHV